jgi:hypothetical protein
VQNPEKKFLFRLAGKLGMTSGELGRRMSYREFQEWRAYLQLCIVEQNIQSKNGKVQLRRVEW